MVLLRRLAKEEAESGAKDLSCFDEEMHPHHLHMFDKKSLEATEYEVQNVATIM